ncbi:MAG: radical SAM protein [Burkholderiales bacterium]
MAVTVERIVSWFKGHRAVRPFEAFQIEVTSRCNLKCVMCPVTVLADGWPSLDMPWRTFERIAAAFDRVKWVYLQGWGEPLLHRRLLDMVERAKGAGCEVGFTTNGTRLTQETGGRLLDRGLDLLAVSIAGATAATHEAIRVGSDFDRLVENLRRFIALRNARQAAKPKVEVFFLMTPANLGELPAAVELAARLGADELVATNLDYVMTPELDALRAWSDAPPEPALRRALDEARAAAARTGIAFRPYSLERREMAVCDLDPLRILFVSADGSVSPCVYTALTGQPQIPRHFAGKQFSIPPVCFGNVNETPLMEIWNATGYRAFRQLFARRVLGARSMALGAFAGAGADDEEAPAPEPCRTCPKLYGY